MVNCSCSLTLGSALRRIDNAVAGLFPQLRRGSIGRETIRPAGKIIGGPLLAGSATAMHNAA
jgi:hypothetical protein